MHSKLFQSKEVGIIVQAYHLDGKISQKRLESQITALNHDPHVHGIIVQLPLPPHLDAREIVNSIDPLKDIDGLHVLNAGRLVCGEETIVPCTPLGCLLLLRTLCPRFSGLNALVIGRSMLVGKPMASLLLQQDCTVTVAHSKTLNLTGLCQVADIVVAAIGQPLLVQKHWIKPGAIVLDVGINRLEDGTIVGDVDFKAVSEVAGAVSPVPGGVGPMTVACLLLNTTLMAARQNNIELTHLPQSPVRNDWCPS